MQYPDRLRRLAVNDARFALAVADDGERVLTALDARSLALVRLAALVAVGGADPSYGEHVDDAVSAGATADEIVDLLVGLIPVVGLPCVVTAAPQLALALGHPVMEDDLSPFDG